MINKCHKCSKIGKYKTRSYILFLCDKHLAEKLNNIDKNTKNKKIEIYRQRFIEKKTVKQIAEFLNLSASRIYKILNKVIIKDTTINVESLDETLKQIYKRIDHISYVVEVFNIKENFATYLSKDEELNILYKEADKHIKVILGK